MPTVVVSKAVSQKVGALLQNRATAIDVFNRLRRDLENDADKFRGKRDGDDPDYFFYTVAYYGNGTWNVLDFSVNDTRATDYLFVDDVS